MSSSFGNSTELNSNLTSGFQNQTNEESPNDQTRKWLPITFLSGLFVLSMIGNLSVFWALITSPSRKNRFSKILLHLTIADLIVTSILIPGEVSNTKYRTTSFRALSSISTTTFYKISVTVRLHAILPRICVSSISTTNENLFISIVRRRFNSRDS